MDPLIVTAVLDPAAREYFDRLRRAHFPAERNHLSAHVTLFHRLPGDHGPAIGAALGATAVPLDVRVSGVRLLGRGVAFDLESAELAALRAGLARRWDPWLSAQDRGLRRLHVTVQNKVDPAVARALHEDLAAGFAPWTVRCTGLALWRYLGGPWEAVGEYPG